jgi:hypothetical protein
MQRRPKISLTALHTAPNNLQERIINNRELFLRLAEAVNIPKGKSGKLNPTKPLFGKLIKVAHRLDRNIQQGA